MERISFVLVVFCTLFNYIVGQCPTNEENVQEWGSSCYYFMPPNGGYDTAKDYCERQLDGGNRYKLLHIDTQAEQDYIKQTIRNSYIDFERTFLGAKEIRGPLSWVSDGTSIQASEGCVQSFERNLFNSGPISAVNSREDCKNSCNSQGTYYAYSAVRFYDAQNLGGMECFCGNNFPEPSAYCNTACPNDASEMCGNIERNRGVDQYGTALPDRVTAAYVSSNMNYEVFMDWAEYQPRIEAYGGVDCVVLSGTNWDEYKWAMQPCHELLKFICEYPSNSASACTNAGFTWTFTQGVNRCFKLHETPQNYIGARIQCMAGGGDLVKSDLESYNTELKEAARNRDSASSNSNWWIGASKSEWKWDDDSFVSFQEFAVRQPDNDQQNCVVVSRNAGGGDLYKWEDAQCNENYHFVCEYTAPTPAATTPTTKAATMPTQPTTTRARPTQAATTPTTTKKPTVKPAGTVDPGAVAGTEQSWLDETFTTGVIVAVAICGLAVLIAFIRLIVYCCQRKSGGDIES